MPTLMDYAYMAQAIYNLEEKDVLKELTANCPGWAIRFWQAGTAGNGFQGAILDNDEEVVCVYKGSATKGPTPKNDWLINDVQIMLNLLPSQTNSAAEMVEVAERVLCGGYGSRRRPLSIVGHSLGGGLAQLVGYLRKIPFVTFNAPGMVGNIEYIPFLKVKPRGKDNGFNMILWTDPVGNFGRHIGKTERFMTPGAFNPLRGGGFIAHQMGSVIEALKRRPKWAQKMLSDLL